MKMLNLIKKAGLRNRNLAGLRNGLERLEDRLAPAVITVTGNGDTIAIDGLATLREAITSINNQADINGDVTLNRVGNYASMVGGTPDVINFNILGAGVKTIAVTGTPEPTIVRQLTINGYTQPLATPNTLANADNAKILIQIDGSGAGAAANGLVLGSGSAGSTIKGLDISNFQADTSFNGGVGILVQSNGNSIVGNFVGVIPTGMVQTLNGGDGIRITNASNNIIGTTNPADRNVTSGNNLDGIHVVGAIASPATGNLIQGNFVGVAADGVSRVGIRTTPVPNASALGTDAGNSLFGIEISGGSNNTIGGVSAGARNVVGFNADGIELDNGGQGNLIQGNFVGVGADGVTPVKNLLHGITLRSSTGFSVPFGPPQPNEPGVSFNTIGGTAAGAGNLVEFNGSSGIAVFGNPVSASGQPNIGNTIEGNSIFENGRNSSPSNSLLGIDLTNQFTFPTDDGLTANDSRGHGAPNDPNNFQNFPMLSSATLNNGQTTVVGTLKGSSGLTYRIEFFASNTDPLGLPAEGQQFLGFTNSTTDASGNVSFSAALNVAVAIGHVVTATATDPIGSTSEFSTGLPVAQLVTGLAVSGQPNGTALLFTPNPAGQYNTTPVATLSPFGNNGADVRTAIADINGDGIPDTILVTGPGTPIRVAVVSGVDNTTVLVAPFDPFGGNFTGGGFVSAGSFDASGHSAFVVTPDQGGGPRVSIFALTPAGLVTKANFFGIDDPSFRGGARSAVGDVNADGTPDLVVTAGFGGGPRVAIFNGTTVFATPTRLVNDFFAFPGADAVNLRTGIFVAVGDMNGDGFGDLVFSAGPGGAPRVFILSGQQLAAGNVVAAQASPIANFFVANDSTSRNGVQVATVNADGDSKADVVVGSGALSPAKVRVYLGKNFSGIGEPTTFQDVPVFGGATITDGVFVG